MPDLESIRRDLLEEQGVLDAIVAGLRESEWQSATPSPGWSVSDQIGHLAYFDGSAANAISDPDLFKAQAAQLVASPDLLEVQTLHRDLAPPSLIALWRDNRRRLADASSELGAESRVPWYGPPMGARSFLSARLMEVWAHGQDIVDAVGAERSPTDRLRHVAQLGYITRRWTYANRGLQLPPGEVRLELTAPSGGAWEWGPDDAGDLVRGPALAFCLVVTQRRNVDDTDLEVIGETASDWLSKAQAFAGPPTEGPRPGTRGRPARTAPAGDRPQFR
jgi:uncharacterized protein (TIGR03084 family)